MQKEKPRFEVIPNCWLEIDPESVRSGQGGRAPCRRSKAATAAVPGDAVAEAALAAEIDRIARTVRRTIVERCHDLSPNVSYAFIERSKAIWNFQSRKWPLCHRVTKGSAMKKTLLAFVAVATLAVSTASPALAWRGGWWGPGIAAGVIGGAIVGSAIASSPYYYGPGYGYYGPGYYPPGYAYSSGPVGPCYWQHQRFWDGYAWRVRNVRVCG
jgi:hypothetical protein